MTDLLSYLSTKYEPTSSVSECFSGKEATSAEGIMQYFEPSYSEASKVSGDIFSSPEEGGSINDDASFLPISRGPIELSFPEKIESQQEQKPVYSDQIENVRTDKTTENLDPMRYVDLQLEVLRQLAGKNDRFLDSIPFDPRYKPMREAADQIRRQDRDSFRNAERNVKDALDREAGYLGMSGGRVTARYGDPDYRRQESVADRYKELEDLRRHFR